MEGFLGTQTLNFSHTELELPQLSVWFKWVSPERKARENARVWYNRHVRSTLLLMMQSPVAWCKRWGPAVAELSGDLLSSPDPSCPCPSPAGEPILWTPGPPSDPGVLWVFGSVMNIEIMEEIKHPFPLPGGAGVLLTPMCSFIGWTRIICHDFMFSHTDLWIVCPPSFHKHASICIGCISRTFTFTSLQDTRTPLSSLQWNQIGNKKQHIPSCLSSSGITLLESHLVHLNWTELHMWKSSFGGTWNQIQLLNDSLSYTSILYILVTSI